MEDHIVARGECLQNKLESTIYSSFGLGLTRETRATVDQVLDPKTIEVLLKMQKKGIFNELAGCISTGKEANVYFGVKDDDLMVAVKVYKTSILGFRDRDEYVDGEFRFRHGYCRSNPRKMVALWAEKEQRNLIRLCQAGVNCPTVIRCTRNVLVMTLVGEPGRAAPRLKDITREPSIGWLGVYLDVIRSMRRMYQTCRLVHGDLSEYNMLLDKDDRVFIIDVSQSVGIDHPRSLEFLKRDCLNINLFFEKKLDDEILPLQELFTFLISPAPSSSITAPVIQTELPSKDQRLSDIEEIWLARLLETGWGDDDDDEHLADSIFMQTWVPSSLGEIGDVQEVERLISDKSKGLSTVYDSLISTPHREDDEGSSDDEDEGISDEGEGSSDEGEGISDEEQGEGYGSEDSSEQVEGGDGRDGHRPANMTRQEWKKMVKEEKREGRKRKVPKHLKQKRNLKKYGCK